MSSLTTRTIAITKVTRAALPALLLVLGAQRIEAQDSSLRLTITGGPHAGTYELAHGQCDALKGSIISMFTPQLSGQDAGRNGLESIEVYTTPGSGKPDGWAVTADFRAKSGRRVVYEIYAMPPELQGPGPKEPMKGSGKVTITQGEDGTGAAFRGQTADGVKMEGSVKCDKRRSK
jgi:hypothetical protein